VPTDVTQRFLAKVAIAGEDECWPWMATLINSGYGRFWFEGRTQLAHRVSYILFVGPIPDDMTLDHTCHNEDPSCAGGPTCQHRRCVNPTHVEPVTSLVNVMRGKTIPAINAAKTHCVNGHEFTPRNTIVYTDRFDRPFRYCLACEHERSLKRSRKQARVTVKIPGVKITARRAKIGVAKP
jgi:hypothetical protein